jgi:hypothetical protein
VCPRPRQLTTRPTAEDVTQPLGFAWAVFRLSDSARSLSRARRRGGLSLVSSGQLSPRADAREEGEDFAEGRHYSTFSRYTPQELRAAIATFLARLPGPEVCWVDEHLLVVAGASRRNQMEPDGPGRGANQAIKDQAPQISAARAGQAPNRRPGGRAQITPLCARPIAGDNLRHSAQIGGSARVLPGLRHHAV